MKLSITMPFDDKIVLAVMRNNGVEYAAAEMDPAEFFKAVELLK